MKAYADASVIVSAYVQEVNSQAARAWLFTLVPGKSTRCVTEVASALAAKVRRREIPSDDGKQYLNAATRSLTGSAIVIGVEQQHFALAAELLTRCEPQLRASDALHLAIASAAGVTLCTLDRRMAEAGQALGLDVQLLC